MQIYEQVGGTWALQADDGSIQTFPTEREAQMAEIGSPIKRWYDASVALCRAATTEIIDRTATPQRIYATSGLQAMIAAAEPLAELEPGITREMLQEMQALWTAFGIWSQTPLDDPDAHGKSPIQILSELGGA